MHKYICILSLALFLIAPTCVMGSAPPRDLPREENSVANQDKQLWVLLKGKARMDGKWREFILTSLQIRDNTSQAVHLYRVPDNGYTQTDHAVIWLAYHAGKLWLDCGEGAFDLREELTIQESFKWIQGSLYQFTGESNLVRDLEVFIKFIEP